MRKCSDMNYHYGVILKVYPSDQQKRIITVNDGAQRAVYNRLVGSGNEIYRLKKTADFVLAGRKRLEGVICQYRNPDGKNSSPDPRGYETMPEYDSDIGVWIGKVTDSDGNVVWFACRSLEDFWDEFRSVADACKKESK